MWWKKKPAPSSAPAPDNRRVYVFRYGDEIVIGGRTLQEDQDPIDLMEKYFKEGPPDAQGS